jgi:hypothetical protein
VRNTIGCRCVRGRGVTHRNHPIRRFFYCIYLCPASCSLQYRIEETVRFRLNCSAGRTASCFALFDLYSLAIVGTVPRQMGTGDSHIKDHINIPSGSSNMQDKKHETQKLSYNRDSLGFGSVSREDRESITLKSDSAGLHMLFRMSRQIWPV